MRTTSGDMTLALVVAVAVLPFAAVAGAGCGLVWRLTADVAEGKSMDLGGPTLLAAGSVIAVLAVGLIRAAWCLVVHLRADARLARQVRAASPHGAGERLGPGIDVVDHEEPFAFAYGLRSARIALSSGLLDRLSCAELEAVVAHERDHQRSRDPLKLLIARLAEAAGFFLPAVKHLSMRHLVSRELAADRCAVRARGSAALAGALCKAVPGPQWDALRVAAPIACPDLLAMRVEQLERGTQPILPRLTARSIGVSIVVLASLTSVIVAVSLRAGVLMCTLGTMSVTPAHLAIGVTSAVACAASWVSLALVAIGPLTRPSPAIAGR